MLDRAPRLKAWSTISVGYDNFDVADLTRRGIVLAHTPDVLTESTADTVFSLIPSARRVVELAEWVKAGHWHRSIGPDLYGTDVQGKTLGIVEPGRIGGAVARRAALGFRMQVLYANRSAHAQAETQYGAARHARRTARASGFRVPAGAAVAGNAPPDRCGRIREDEARCDPDQRIAWAGGRRSRADRCCARARSAARGLTCSRREPLAADSPLLQMKNVVALPHIGSATHETRHAMARCAAENPAGALAGTLRTNLVNPDALARA